MIIDRKIVELDHKKFAEYIKVKGRYKWQTDLQDVACFIYWLNGHNKLYTGNTQVVSSGKEALLLKCGAYIDELFPVAGEEIEAVIIHFYPEILKGLFQNDFPESLKNTPAPGGYTLKMLPSDLLEKYVDNLMLYLKHPEYADDALLHLKLKELVLLLCKTQQRQTVETMFRHLFHNSELSFHELIQANLYTNLSLKELAYLAHRSMASFKRDFQKYYQCTPSLYLKHKKLEKAAKLLATTDWRIIEIVTECGFMNVSHFTRLFHQKFNMTPSAYRMSQNAHSLS